MSWTARATAAEVKHPNIRSNGTVSFFFFFLNRLDVTCADDSPFFENDMPTMRSSSSSSEGLPHVINCEGSVESNEVTFENSVLLFYVSLLHVFCFQDSDPCKRSSSRRATKSHHSKGKSRHGNADAGHSSGSGNCCKCVPPSYNGPKVSLTSSLLSFSVYKDVYIHSVHHVGPCRFLGADRLFKIPPAA